ncbi:choline transporter [Pasteurellaceae bacterium 15-036681]|nr:choline transporter [Pasteurellaceae bacterium 15-036681]
MRITTTFNKPVVFTSLVSALSLIVFVLIIPDIALNQLAFLKQVILAQFGWLYILSCGFFIFFLIFLAFSRYGDIKLGSDDEEPEFSLKSWFSLLFTAGMGIGIIFLGVSEPLSHYVNPIEIVQTERQAIFQSIFHWSVNAWAIYAVMALAIGYFGFRYKLPLSLRSCFYPLFKQRINGKVGDVIDILGLCTTLFGLITTLAYGVVRLVSAFGNNVSIQLLLIAIFIVAIFIATQRLNKGLRLISEWSLILSLLLLAFVLVVGPTSHLLSALTENIGFYLSSVLPAGLKTYSYQPQYKGWFSEWTILYWAWWFSWAPAFGIFIARISKGRTIREFIWGVLIVPSLFFVIWFSIFGNGAIWIETTLADSPLSNFIDQSGKLLFLFLEQLPFYQGAYYIALIVISLFFITTVDFGVYILNNISAQDKSVVSPRWQIVFWGGLISILTAVLFQFGGIETLQATMLLFSLPFALLMLVMAFSLLKGLNSDFHYHHATLAETNWNDEDWRKKLTTMLTPHNQQNMAHYLKYIALPAMRELRQELIGIYDLNIHLLSEFDEHKWIELTIEMNNSAFSYKLMLEDNHLMVYTQPELAYIIQPLEKDELIAEILARYDEFSAQSL